VPTYRIEDYLQGALRNYWWVYGHLNYWVATTVPNGHLGLAFSNIALHCAGVFAYFRGKKKRESLPEIALEANCMEEKELISALNARKPAFIELLGGKIIAVDPATQSCTFEFNISTQFCHSVDVVQGGFITTMLDAAMSHAVFASLDDITCVSSLEIKTSYLAPSRAGRLRAVGNILKSSYKTAFLEGRLYNDEGTLTATTSSVAKLVRKS
jgi:uncharacterized protein (TIGR00369 family)